MGLLRRLQAAIRRLIRAVQKVVMVVLLFGVYWLGFGVSRLLAMVFQRELLQSEHPDQDSFWRAAEGYDAEVTEARHQT